MLWLRAAAMIAFSLVLVGAEPVKQPAYLAPDSFDFKALLGEPPADRSDAQKQEIDELLKMQAQRTPTEAARCEAEEKSDAFFFADVMGPGFDAKALPVTADLLHAATRQVTLVAGAAKATFNRNRPYTDEPRLHSLGVEKSKSYPSGHATRGMAWGLILAEIYPDSREILIARGKQYGIDRNIAGVHYPSDVKAGQKLAGEIVKRMLADPDFQAELEKAKEECHAKVTKSE